MTPGYLPDDFAFAGARLDAGDTLDYLGRESEFGQRRLTVSTAKPWTPPDQDGELPTSWAPDPPSGIDPGILAGAPSRVWKYPCPTAAPCGSA